MKKYEYKLPTSKHKIIIEAESQEKADERFKNIFKPKDE